STTADDGMSRYRYPREATSPWTQEVVPFLPGQRQAEYPCNSPDLCRHRLNLNNCGPHLDPCSNTSPQQHPFLSREGAMIKRGARCDGKARALCNATPASTQCSRADRTEPRIHNGPLTPHQDGTNSPGKSPPPSHTYLGHDSQRSSSLPRLPNHPANASSPSPPVPEREIQKNKVNVHQQGTRTWVDQPSQAEHYPFAAPVQVQDVLHRPTHQTVTAALRLSRGQSHRRKHRRKATKARQRPGSPPTPHVNPRGTSGWLHTLPRGKPQSQQAGRSAPPPMQRKKTCSTAPPTRLQMQPSAWLGARAAGGSPPQHAKDRAPCQPWRYPSMLAAHTTARHTTAYPTLCNSLPLCHSSVNVIRCSGKHQAITSLTI
ncbi:hypothetical protein AMECASPLE_028467, partial [Ameca splendens]